MSNEIEIGERVVFDSWNGPEWLARAASDDGRYVLLTALIDGNVCYTIVDYKLGRRGAMNIVGGGLGIKTTAGPDEAIDEAMRMLADGWEVSSRNYVTLVLRRRSGVSGSCETPGPVEEQQR